MKRTTSKVLAGALLLGLCQPVVALAADQDLQQKMDALEKELNLLKDQLKDTAHKVDRVESKSLGRWLTISGDYMFRYDYLRAESPSYYPFMPGFTPATSTSPAGAATYLGLGPYAQPFGPTGPFVGSAAPASTVSNTAVYTHRFGLNLNAKPVENVTFAARLLMYKAWGNQSDSVLQAGNTAYSFDRAGLFDGTIGHLPGSSFLDVDRIYVDWENIADEPIWFSIGRRPSTDGIPTHLKNNTKRPGVGGIPALLVNYAFDGLTLGWAPDFDMLPGAYGKFCYGRGFSTGLSDTRSVGNSLKDTDMIGVQMSPYNTDALQVLLQYNRAFNVFDAPEMVTGPFSQMLTGPKANLGDIDWYGVNLLGEVKNVGPGTFNWFVQGAVDVTHPNSNTLKLYNPYDPSGQSYIETNQGLLWSGSPNSTTGWSVFAGMRYDFLPTLTKLGFEFNHGSKNWITFSPAEDDMWTTKVGTRGNVYEAYLIQELPLKPISSYFSKVFFRIGYQYYDFDYTGSNSWLGAPVDMAELNSPMSAQMTAPLRNAEDVYATFELHF
ncbi:hypothetical protein GURASL_15220 [Geotalea uraniireducens]|uniref:DUF3373 domain-containing protein n=1 Tax=Geotalea uraniireducens TaxID=351604 RepID=A0ABN6VRE0_9BACT|nr:DUF3373 domain-containing protein [Geotalea uraniireducens]BDV42599.1 hypothetical protein GURASL_15220 [Geotalea uraniireducens]